MIDLKLPDFALQTIINYIRDFVGDKNVVVGLSGGIDSAVVAKLCVEALSKDRVLLVHMPDSTTPPEDTEDAREFVDLLGCAYREINIDESVKAMVSLLGLKSPLSVANLKARTRMTILYAIANEENRLVAGTSNKSELLIGYFTKYGDGASDFAPIGDLYKTQVRELARLLEIPEKIITKTPRAGLILGQTDEGEIGIRYDDLDRILYGMELSMTPEEISIITGIDIEAVKRVYSMHEKSRHKRVMLYIPKIGIRTVNTDWRE